MSLNPLQIAFGVFLAVIACEQSTSAQDVVQEATKVAEGKEIVLDVSPAPAPTPLFRYQLLPMASELNPGDAAPIYLRLGFYHMDGLLDELNTKAITWLGQPLASFPTEEAKKAIEGLASKFRQIEFGTRRRTCDWNYTILEEQDNPFSILLPDAQNLRTWSRLLDLKARVEITSGHLDASIKAIGTGIGFGRHLAGGPFYINKLIGIATIHLMLDRADELVGRPGTPNLSWALLALPQPLVDLREATENERASMGRALTGQRLEEIDLTRPRSDVEWSAMLAQLHARMLRVETMAGPEPAGTPVTAPNLETFRATMLPKAQEYLRSRQVAATSDDQGLVLTIIGLYRELADEYFQFAHVPYPYAIEREAEVARRIQAAKSGPASIFVRMLPAVQSVHLSGARLARKVAALRVVEALRLFAAEHRGALPESLDEIKAVPIPNDPLTGKPFVFTRDGDVAVLTGVSASPVFRLVYRIKIRK